MIRRVWRVLADPPTSWEAGAAMLAVPIGVAWVGLAVLGERLDLVIARLLMLAWVLIALRHVRQRDRAWAELAQLRRAGGGR